MARRPKVINANLNLTLPQELKDRVDTSLRPGEKRLDFIRDAIARELKRRDRAAQAATAGNAA